MTKPVICKCGVVLSIDGLGWNRQGYRVSRRNIDGTPIRGIVSRPTVKGVKPMCRACVNEAVNQRKGK
jgi:hypothetical protein